MNVNSIHDEVFAKRLPEGYLAKVRHLRNR